MRERDLWVRLGEEIRTFTGANEAIGTLVLQFPNLAESQGIMPQIQRYVTVIVE